MKRSKKKRVPVEIWDEPVHDQSQAAELLDWKPDGPTLRFDELLKVVKVGRTKAYDLMKTDPDFPEGVPLFDSDRSPRFFWTRDALAWSKKREAKFRRKKGGKRRA